MTPNRIMGGVPSLDAGNGQADQPLFGIVVERMGLFGAGRLKPEAYKKDMS